MLWRILEDCHYSLVSQVLSKKICSYHIRILKIHTNVHKYNFIMRKTQYKILNQFYIIFLTKL